MSSLSRAQYEALFGQNRVRPLGLLAIGVGLVFVALLVEELPFWGAGTLTGGLVFAVLVAGANSYWNDGFLVSLGFAFATAFGWWWGPYLLPPTMPGIGRSGMVVFTIAFVLLTAFPGGIIGYVAGRLLRGVMRPDEGLNVSPWLVSVLVGQKRPRTLVGLAVAVGLFAVGFGAVFYIHEPSNLATFRTAHELRDYFRLADLLHVSSYRYAVLLAWVALPAVYAYWNDGLIVDWALVLGLAYGYNVGFRATFRPNLADMLILPFVQVLIHTLVLGTIGFVVGACLRRLVTHQRGRASYTEPDV